MRVAQVTLPDIQIPFFDKTLRAYVKSIGEKVFYHVEWSLVPNKPVIRSLEFIRPEIKIKPGFYYAQFSYMVTII